MKLVVLTFVVLAVSCGSHRTKVRSSVDPQVGNSGQSDPIIKDPAPTPTPSPTPAPEGAKTIYNGETELFSKAVAWDQTGTSVSEVSEDSFSGSKHVQFTINNVGYWGAGAYVWAAFKPLDLSAFTKLTFKMKSPQAITVKMALVSMKDNTASTYVAFPLTKDYQTVTLDLTKLKADGFDLATSEAIVVATDFQETATFVVDMDDIVAIQ